MVCGRFGKSVGSCAGSVMVLCTFGVVNPGSAVGTGPALEGAPGAEPLALGVDEGDGAGELPLAIGLLAEGLALLGDAMGTEGDGLGEGLGDGLGDGVPDGTCTSGRSNPLQLVLNAETQRFMNHI